MFVVVGLLIVSGLVGADGSLGVVGLILVAAAVVTKVMVWRLVHLGVWTSAEGVEIRAFVRPTGRFSWEDIDEFEVRRGVRLVPGVRPALQVTLLTTAGTAVLVPGLWHRSPFTWAGVGPTRIVDALNERHP